MKKQALSLFVVLGLLLAAGSAFAQTIKVSADVPFKFVVNKANMPAGRYTLESSGFFSDGRLLILRGEDFKVRAAISANSAHRLDPSRRTKLVFKRYRDSYFLSQVWVAGNTSGHEIPHSKRELEMARDYTPEQVVIYASLR